MSSFTHLIHQQGGSFDVCKASVEYLRDTIQKKWASPKSACRPSLVFDCSSRDLMDLIRALAKEISSDSPRDAVIGNVIRRVLRLIRDVYLQCAAQEQKAQPVALSASLRVCSP